MKPKFYNVYGCLHSLLDGIMRPTDVIGKEMIGDKRVLVYIFGDMSNAHAGALRDAGARALIATTSST
eukprot:8606064-Heterocapsa_arctica.AAC.1